ncbi:ABC transporter permease [Cytobacillus firmus]|uniref:ABC-2 family transporter protein n=1 Tax=Cytobacillus firmus TaxID=1399 RepID=A0AA46SH72_CYTFI|nr:ABC-2 family transporter protein [Cytobacillus firmus]MBY6053659.1 ABC-2 family transporter protein [Cytobacillus firmus]MCS0655094.1 ABC-2 family transporter protein [Cytobacillus firmus]UYG93562.1 ABC-2 family transporter protein [Cytobacillus firmus]
MFRFRLYWTFTKKAFLRSAVYRFDVWSRLGSNLIFLLMWGSIWTALYAGREEAGGVSFESMLTYIVVSQFLTGVNGAGTPLWEIQEKVRTGDISLELMRPFDVPLRYLFADFGSVAFYILTALLPLYTVMFIFMDLTLPSGWETWALFIVSAFIGFLIRYCIEMSFGLLSFFLVETGGIVDVFYFAMSLLSGSVIPLWFFPGWLETMALYLPFQGIYYIPNAIFIGKISGSEILLSLGVQLFWAGASYLLLRFVWNRASQKVVVQGG